eukprot:s3304_g3.t1
MDLSSLPEGLTAETCWFIEQGADRSKLGTGVLVHTDSNIATEKTKAAWREEMEKTPAAAEGESDGEAPDGMVGVEDEEDADRKVQESRLRREALMAKWVNPISALVARASQALPTASSVTMGCHASKAAAPAAAQKAPIAVTEAPADSKTSTEAPAEPVPSQEVSPTMQDKAEEPKEGAVPQLPVEEKARR